MINFKINYLLLSFRERK